MKRMLAGVLAAWSIVALAAVDANLATQAELESVAAIGPAICSEILEERRKGAFKDWQDLINRVRGVGANNAAKLSAGGLTVNGVAYRTARPARANTAEGKASQPGSTQAPPGAP